MLTENEKQEILNAYRKSPEAMEKLVDALLVLQTYDKYDLDFIELLKQMTPEERKLILTSLQQKGHVKV